MGTLTSDGRQGLDELFLSIKASNNNYNIFQHMSNITKKELNSAKIGLKKSKIYNFLVLFYKKKKTLSK